MTRRCDRCGAAVIDTVGSRQTSLFDVQSDPRATDEARAELRSGRILCPACARTPELFPGGSIAHPWLDAPSMTPIRITAPPDPFPRPVVDHWTRKVDVDPDDCDDPCEACCCSTYDQCEAGRAYRSIDAAEMAEAVAGLE